MRGTFTHIYLSPHLDDAVLSCGGRVWQQIQAGKRVLVVTVFAGSPAPDARLSFFAQVLRARRGLGIDAEAVRCSEDVAALAKLGEAESLRWPYLNCIYRQAHDGTFPYDTMDSLRAEIYPGDEALIAELAERVSHLPLAPDGVLYAPLGLGRHVDHRIVRRAAEQSGLALLYYEDYPYAEDADAIRMALGDDAWEPEVVQLSEEALEAKIAAIACYASQISAFWENHAQMAAVVRGFGVRVGTNVPAERYWLRRL